MSFFRGLDLCPIKADAAQLLTTAGEEVNYLRVRVRVGDRVSRWMYHDLYGLFEMCKL